MTKHDSIISAGSHPFQVETAILRRLDGEVLV